MQITASSLDDKAAAAPDVVYDCACSSAYLLPPSVGGDPSSVGSGQRSHAVVMSTLRVFVIARASFNAVTNSSSSSSLPDVTPLRPSSGLNRLCDGLMHALQPLTALLVEIIPLQLPVEVLDYRCFVSQACSSPTRECALV